MGKCTGFGNLTTCGRCERESNRGTLYRSVNTDDDIQLLHKMETAKVRLDSIGWKEVLL